MTQNMLTLCKNKILNNLILFYLVKNVLVLEIFIIEDFSSTTIL